MKKFLLSLACVCAFFSANAIKLSFWLGEQEITPGQTVEFHDITVNTDDGYKDVKMKPDLYLKASLFSSDIKIVATCTSGQEIAMCAGGVCMGGATVVKENITIDSNQKLPLDFDYVNDFDLDEEIPTVTSTIEAEDVTEPGSKIQFIIVMGEKNASVTAIELFSDLTAIDGGVTYKAEGECNLTITTLSGVNVYSAKVVGEGVVNLPAGLYVYTFGDRTGKIYIR